MGSETAVVDALTLDLLEWLLLRERTYDEVMDAWRTSCPRLPVWEDANDRGFVATALVHGRSVVSVTERGRLHLDRERPATPARVSAGSPPAGPTR